jgi:glutathione S-transferase
MGTLTLFELGGLDDRRYSQFSWRTRLALAHKGLAANYRPVRVSDKQAIAFSGQDKVPILVDESGVAITDSWRIAEHLESRYQDRPSLFGGAAGHAFARFINNWVDRVLVPQAAAMLMADVIECVDDEDAGHLRRQTERIFGKALEDLRGGRDTRINEFRRALDPARSTLKVQQFLSGSAPAYPDYVLFSVFQWARIVSAFDLLDPGDAALLSWRARMLDLFDGMAARAPPRTEAPGVPDAAAR